MSAVCHIVVFRFQCKVGSSADTLIFICTTEKVTNWLHITKDFVFKSGEQVYKRITLSFPKRLYNLVYNLSLFRLEIGLYFNIVYAILQKSSADLLNPE